MDDLRLKSRLALSAESRRRVWKLQKAIKRCLGLTEHYRTYRGKLTYQSHVPRDAVDALFWHFVFFEVTNLRLYEIGSSACRMLLEEHVVPAAILSRSFGETAALVHDVTGELTNAKDASRALKRLQQALLGSNVKGVPEGPWRVSTLVEAADQKAPGFREHYKHLCEFAHPNLSGVLVAYGPDSVGSIGSGWDDVIEMIAGVSIGFLEMSTNLWLHSYKQLGESVWPKLQQFIKSGE